jgi:hypothetical protein
MSPLGFLFLSFGTNDDIPDQVFSELLDPPQLMPLWVCDIVASAYFMGGIVLARFKLGPNLSGVLLFSSSVTTVHKRRVNQGKGLLSRFITIPPYVTALVAADRGVC